VEALKARLDERREAFFLNGDGPRFMQDLTVHKDAKRSIEPVGALLVDRIGEEGLAEAPSLFAKPGGFDALGYPAAAAALMALQSYAPAGGAGVMTSLRGGGPLTTLVMGEDLWNTVWLNVLPREVFDELVPGDADEDGDGMVFPWAARTRDGSQPTLPNHIHKLQHLWGLPRRVRFVLEDERGTCSVTGTKEVPVIRTYVSRPKGTSYKGAFRHPLTAYSEVKPGQPWNPKKTSADGLPYRDWPLLVTGTKTRAPAAVVSHFMAARRDLVDRPRMIAFGYAMNKMKPLRWSRAETPLIAVSPQQAESFAAEVERLVAASEAVRGTLSAQLREAWSDRPQAIDVAGKVNPAFWSATEPAFFHAVREVKAALEASSLAGLDTAREVWLEALHEAALDLFDTLVDAAAILAPPELGRTVAARQKLVVFTRPASRKLRSMLGLTVPDEAAAGQKAKGRKTTRKKEATT
jgi:CRISPR system Cascade subunit CasA